MVCDCVCIENNSQVLSIELIEIWGDDCPEYSIHSHFNEIKSIKLYYLEQSNQTVQFDQVLYLYVLYEFPSKKLN